LGRKTLIGLGAAVVAAAVAAGLVIADPFAGPLPDGWTTKKVKDVAASLAVPAERSEEHTSELQSLMRTSYAVFCLKKNKIRRHEYIHNTHTNTYSHTPS